MTSKRLLCLIRDYCSLTPENVALVLPLIWLLAFTLPVYNLKKKKKESPKNCLHRFLLQVWAWDRGSGRDPTVSDISQHTWPWRADRLARAPGCPCQDRLSSSGHAGPFLPACYSHPTESVPPAWDPPFLPGTPGPEWRWGLREGVSQPVTQTVRACYLSATGNPNKWSRCPPSAPGNVMSGSSLIYVRSRSDLSVSLWPPTFLHLCLIYKAQ